MRKETTVIDDLPESFDLRQAYPYCESLKEIRNQGSCGSCWAFGAAEVMSDRICIHSKETLQTRISPLQLITCCTNCGNGCHGGWPSLAFRYWKQTGLPSGRFMVIKKDVSLMYLSHVIIKLKVLMSHVIANIDHLLNVLSKCIPESKRIFDEDLWFA